MAEVLRTLILTADALKMKNINKVIIEKELT